MSDMVKELADEAARLVREAGGRVVDVKVEPTEPAFDLLGPMVTVTVDADAKRALEIWAEAARGARGKGFILDIAWTGERNVSPEEYIKYAARAHARMDIPILVDDAFDVASVARRAREDYDEEEIKRKLGDAERELEGRIVELQVLYGKHCHEHGTRPDPRFALFKVVSVATWAWRKQGNGHYAFSLFRAVDVLARALGHEDIARPAGEAAELIGEIMSLRGDLDGDEEDPGHERQHQGYHGGGRAHGEGGRRESRRRGGQAHEAAPGPLRAEGDGGGRRWRQGGPRNMGEGRAGGAREGVHTGGEGDREDGRERG